MTIYKKLSEMKIKVDERLGIARHTNDFKDSQNYKQLVNLLKELSDNLSEALLILETPIKK